MVHAKCRPLIKRDQPQKNINKARTRNLYNFYGRQNKIKESLHVLPEARRISVAFLHCDQHFPCLWQ